MVDFSFSKSETKRISKEMILSVFKAFIIAGIINTCFAILMIFAGITGEIDALIAGIIDLLLCVIVFVVLMVFTKKIEKTLSESFNKSQMDFLPCSFEKIEEKFVFISKTNEKTAEFTKENISKIYISNRYIFIKLKNKKIVFLPKTEEVFSFVKDNIISAQPKKTYIKNIVLCSIFSFLTLLILFLGISIAFLAPKYTDYASEEIVATVVKVEESGSGYAISVEEQLVPLKVYSSHFVEKDAISAIKSGDKVYFRIYDEDGDGFSSRFIILALRTDTRDVITLDSYEKAEKESNNKSQTVAFVGASICAVVVVTQIFVIIKKKKPTK